MRQTQQNAATLEVSLVVLGPPWGPLWPWVCDKPILDLDEIDENKKTFDMSISLGEGHILLLSLNLVFHLPQK